MGSGGGLQRVDCGIGGHDGFFTAGVQAVSSDEFHIGDADEGQNLFHVTRREIHRRADGHPAEA